MSQEVMAGLQAFQLLQLWQEIRDLAIEIIPWQVSAAKGASLNH